MGRDAEARVNGGNIHDSVLSCVPQQDSVFRKEGHMNRAMVFLLVVVLCATVGCANMTPQQQRALSGGAIGAAGGAAVGAIVGGSPAIGAAVGGATGAAAGALWDDINRALK